MAITATPPLLEVDDLLRLGHDPALIILDASWSLTKRTEAHRQAFDSEHIPGARFFDLDHEFSDCQSEFPHMLPPAAAFQRSARALGINKQSHIVVYDSLGMFSAPRAWWMFQAMGHLRVSVLNGGLPAWVNGGGELSDTQGAISSGDFIARLQPRWLADTQGVLSRIIQGRGDTIVDLRPAERFRGATTEPRSGLRSGHMPGARNLPFSRLVKAGKLLSTNELKQVLPLPFTQPPIFTCGSGITACIGALAVNLLGYEAAVYDGSWAQWGANEALPIEAPAS